MVPIARRFKEKLPAPMDNASRPTFNVMDTITAKMGVMSQSKHAAPTARRLKEELPARMGSAPGPGQNVMAGDWGNEDPSLCA